MHELDDHALLREYAERGSEEAFAELVARHVNKVYSAAWRHTGNPHQAQEITQAVFVMLAQKARRLGRGVILSGWLYHAARLAAITFTRAEIRRARREEAHMQTILNESDPGSGLWPQIAPMLDAAMERLDDRDRAAVVLRYFDGKSMREIGHALGASEAAAQKRVDRAIDKLRRYFEKRGVASTAALIGGAISAHAVQPAPADIVNIISGAAVQGAAAGGSTIAIVKGALELMAWNTKMAVVGAAVLGIAAVTVVHNQQKLSAENDALRAQIAGLLTDNQSLSNSVNHLNRVRHLPAPSGHITLATPSASTDLSASNIIAGYLKSEGKNDIPLTAGQVAAYLKAYGRKPSTLIAAYEASHDPSLLEEAMQKFPTNAQVDLAAIFHVSADDQRQWINALEQSDPNNALANYISAKNYFDGGQGALAVQELDAAAGKTQYQDYSIDSMLNLEEAYRAAGYPEAAADVIGAGQLLLPQYSAMRDLGQDMVSLAGQYQQSGDPASAQAALQMDFQMGQQMGSTGDPFIIGNLVDNGIERGALLAMDPTAPFGDTGQTVQDELNQLLQQRNDLRSQNDQFNAIADQMIDPDWISYRQREALFGDPAAQQWALGKYGQP